MNRTPESDLTRRLQLAEQDPHARDAVLAEVYQDLLRIARAELSRHRRGATLNTRALVSEAYLKLFPRGSAAHFENRRHFFATAAKAMRQVVIDHSRARLADRRGAGAEHVSLDDALHAGEVIRVDEQAERLIAIDSALGRLAERDPRLAQVIEMRFFGGMEVVRVAEVLGVSVPTVVRDTRTARAFLEKELREAG